ncbi:MAG: AAA family ATPase [Caldilineaceae bacterium]|nr:AAA family ATPase [Caldilineaceae bacterium]
MVYALYGFLRDLGERMVRVMDTWSNDGLVSNALGADVDFVIGELLGSGEFGRQVDIGDLEKDRERLVQGSASLFSQSELDDVFGAEPETFDSAVFDVEIDRPRFRHITLVYGLRDDMELAISFQEDTLSFSLTQAHGKEEIGSAIHPRELGIWLRRVYIHFLMLDDFDHPRQPHCTTSARLSVSLFYQDLETNVRWRFREIQQGTLIRSQDGSEWISGETVRRSSRYALPIEDEINFTKDIPSPFAPQPSKGGPSPVSDIERMTGGYYSKEDDEVFFNSSENNDRQFCMPLYLASSSATELSNLYFFFAMGRHSKDLILIIDEPESHLDTINQINFARALVRWVNSGVRILVSTHSDYIIKELNNLIMLDSDFENKNEVMERLGYKDSIKPRKVKVYVAKNGTLVECEKDKYGIDMPHFDKTIDNINAVSNELTARLSAEEGGK